jgi:peptidoglycan hydrolase-like protein with peptidoglycan-binding domain
MRRTARLGLLVCLLWALAVPALAASVPPWARGIPPAIIDGGHLAVGATAASTTWYFAEGHTGPDFDEFLVVTNPGDQPANVGVTVLGAGATRGLAVPAKARASVNVKDMLPEGDGGLAVSSSQPVVAERVMYFNYRGQTGGSSTVGVTDTSTTWLFGEGYTGPGFSTFILLSNPAAVATVASVTFEPEGGAPVNTAVSIPAQGRVSLNGADYVPGKSFATAVSSSTGIVAERTMYFTYNSTVTGGDASMGARAPLLRWDFAEGSTNGFDTYYLLGNTTTATAVVDVVFRTGGGAVKTVSSSVAPGSRLTIRANDVLPPGEAGATVISRNGVPIVAERAMYFDHGRWNGGTATLGAAALSPTWLFAEGFTSSEFEAFVLVANPADAPTAATISLRKPDGTGTDLPVSIGPRSRVGVRVNDVAGFANSEFGTIVTSALPVVAERSSYFHYPSRYFDAGLLGTRELAYGMSGNDVFEVQRRMLQVGLDPGPVDGTFSDNTEQAAIAIEKYMRLPRRGVVGAAERQFLVTGLPPVPRNPSGDHVEIDIPRQVSYYVRGGNVIAWWPTSTGATDNTPRGTFNIYRKAADWECGDLGCLYSPSYFIAGYAIHGYPSVPTYPASHGCSRVPMGMADWVFDALPVGFEVFVYD